MPVKSGTLDCQYHHLQGIMEEDNDVLVSATAIIKDRLYFVTLQGSSTPKSTPNSHYFTIVGERGTAKHLYESFFADFGPYQLSVLYRFCEHLMKKLTSDALSDKKIFFCIPMDPQDRVNAAFLIGSFAILYLKKTPKGVYKMLKGKNGSPPFIKFRDASKGAAVYLLSLFDCLCAVSKAHKLGFFNFDDYDAGESDYYELVENGDSSWIVPDKFIAFCGPHSESKIENGYQTHSPESYFPYFRRNNVTTIIRLNRKLYDAQRFINAGFEHEDLYFIDGTTPCDFILQKFLQISENAKGAVAVHCKAGLGRTGSLIACYIMKHYRMTAMEAIAWIRLCRPGSIIGYQQHWLKTKERQMWREGDAYRLEHGRTPRPAHGIYSFTRSSNTPLMGSRFSTPSAILKGGLLEKVDTMKLDDSTNDLLNRNYKPSEETVLKPSTSRTLTQGDELNQIKTQRQGLLSRGLPSSASGSQSAMLTGRPCTRSMSQLLKSPDGSLANNQYSLRSPKAVASILPLNSGAKRTYRGITTTIAKTKEQSVRPTTVRSTPLKSTFVR